MLVQLAFCGLIYASFGAFSFPSLTPDFRYTLPVDTCIKNVSSDGTDFYGGEGGSMICHCNEESITTKSSVMCHFYEETDCTGELQDERIWGGCENDQYLYTVENCTTAQEAAASEDGCAYWVKADSGGNTDLNQIVTPLYQCMDYNCNGDNSDPDAQSCYYACGSQDDEVQERLYSDYECAGSGPQINTESFSERSCAAGSSSAGCGVRITKYDIGSNYACGSSKSPFKTKSGNGKVKYFMEANRNIPIPIGDCFEVRNGFYSYSYKYECESDEETDISTVMKKVYLGSSNCKGDDYHIAQNYSSLNYTVSCQGGNGKGAYGQYGSCLENNWDSYYADTPMLFGQCVPFMLNPDAIGGDDGKLADRPWNQNLRVVFSCNLKKRYLSAYFYVDENCKGDYLFYWDWDNEYWNTKSNNWGYRACGRPKIQNCGNSADTAGERIGDQLYYN